MKKVDKTSLDLLLVHTETAVDSITQTKLELDNIASRVRQKMAFFAKFLCRPTKESSQVTRNIRKPYNCAK